MRSLPEHSSYQAVTRAVVTLLLVANQAMLVLAAVNPVLSTDAPSLVNTTLDSGGTLNARGGTYELSGTIAQPDTGPMTGDDLQLTGGFWRSVVAPDCDSDGFFTLRDFDGFALCLGGPAVDSTDLCWCGDTNVDRRIDLRDFAQFQNILQPIQ